MSRGINKVIIIGNCCADPEVKYMPSGGAVTNIGIATNESWKDKNTGQMQERSEFHRVVFFNRLGEIAGEYLRKGSKVYIEGSLRTRKWQAQDGTDRYTTEIVASEMQMLDGKQESAGKKPAQSNAQQHADAHGYGAVVADFGSGHRESGLAKPSNSAPAGFDDFDDVPY